MATLLADRVHTLPRSCSRLIERLAFYKSGRIFDTISTSGPGNICAAAQPGNRMCPSTGWDACNGGHR